MKIFLRTGGIFFLLSERRRLFFEECSTKQSALFALADSYKLGFTLDLQLSARERLGSRQENRSDLCSSSCRGTLRHLWDNLGTTLIFHHLLGNVLVVSKRKDQTGVLLHVEQEVVQVEHQQLDAFLTESYKYWWCKEKQRSVGHLSGVYASISPSLVNSLRRWTAP